MLIEDRIDTEAEACDCDTCGRPIAVGERVAVDLAAGQVFCTRCTVELCQRSEFERADR